MSTRMDEEDWAHTLRVFRACLPRRGRKAEDDRQFLKALHFFAVENVRWRALPERFGHWNSVWKRFDRLSKAGVFEAFFDALASMSSSAHLIQMFDSTIVRAHVSAAGAKGGKSIRRSGVRAAVSPRKSTPNRMHRATSSLSTCLARILVYPSHCSARALYKARARIEQGMGRLKRIGRRLALRLAEQALRANQRGHHDRSQLRRMGDSVRRRQDDNSAARSSHSPMPHR